MRIKRIGDVHSLSASCARPIGTFPTINFNDNNNFLCLEIGCSKLAESSRRDPAAASLSKGDSLYRTGLLRLFTFATTLTARYSFLSLPLHETYTSSF